MKGYPNTISKCGNIAVKQNAQDNAPGLYSMTDKVDTESFKQFERLRELRVDHRDLDYLIDSLSHDPLVDQLRMRRLKKRRLILKDMISQLESELIPDMDA